MQVLMVFGSWDSMAFFGGAVCDLSHGWVAALSSFPVGFKEKRQSIHEQLF